MNKYKIRKAVSSDLDTLLGFEQGVIDTERPFDPTLKPGLIHYYDIAKMIRARDVELLVAEFGKELIGCGYARIETAKPYLKHAQHAYLGFMYVRPEHRGKGVNRLIINGLEKWAASRRVPELLLDVYQPNQSAILAYEKAGFIKHMISMRKQVNS